jgi:hypothetical protein
LPPRWIRSWNMEDFASDWTASALPSGADGAAFATMFHIVASGDPLALDHAVTTTKLASSTTPVNMNDIAATVAYCVLSVAREGIKAFCALNFRNS